MKKILAILVIAALLFVTACATKQTEDEQQLLGGDKDEHGCIGSAGYTWCEPKQKCLREWEEPCDPTVVGADRDEHGCIASAGYTWCEPKQKCLRTWEEACE